VPSWQGVAHDADIGLIGTGPTKAEAFRQAALALTAVVTDPTLVQAVAAVSVVCRLRPTSCCSSSG
jgi:tRNA nucleotidyltransferase (CCA-adding enzyme)